MNTAEYSLGVFLAPCRTRSQGGIPTLGANLNAWCKFEIMVPVLDCLKWGVAEINVNTV